MASSVISNEIAEAEIDKRRQKAKNRGRALPKIAPFLPQKLQSIYFPVFQEFSSPWDSLFDLNDKTIIP